ncbi:hypothetical protein VP01_1315g3 [Puccinia sorghi]|uniref:SRR1-like domain-containing protein n=1 Tax=Puccinia sorghi TaxID=27349 RepID=A0A0L6VMS1_9BASI|nr:hypothetical protein VP01_1315g3 [Puccinia sorghi]
MAALGALRLHRKWVGVGLLTETHEARTRMQAETDDAAYALCPCVPVGSFQYVEHRSTKKHRKRRNNNKARSLSAADLPTRSPAHLASLLDSRRLVLQKSGWLSQSKSQSFPSSVPRSWFARCLKDSQVPGPARNIVCLALGSFSPDTSSHPSVSDRAGTASCIGIHALKQSQYQLVFLLDVILPILSAHQQAECLSLSQEDEEPQTVSPIHVPSHASNMKVSFYDPAFTQKDRETLSNLGHVVLDAEPTLRCEEPTLFYMPHAPKTLYERLVSQNSPSHNRMDNLSQIILVGNDLSSYQKIMVQEEKDSIPVLMQLDPSAILALHPPDLTQLNHDTGVHFFNETCFQWFRMS